MKLNKKKHFFLWLFLFFFPKHCTSQALAFLNLDTFVEAAQCVHYSPLLNETHPFQQNRLQSNVAQAPCRPIGDIKNIHIFLWGPMAPPVVLWASQWMRLDRYITQQFVNSPRGSLGLKKKRSPVHNNVLESLRSTDAQLEDTVLAWGTSTAGWEGTL